MWSENTPSTYSTLFYTTELPFQENLYWPNPRDSYLHPYDHSGRDSFIIQRHYTERAGFGYQFPWCIRLYEEKEIQTDYFSSNNE